MSDHNTPTIGFSNGTYYRLFPDEVNRFSPQLLDNYRTTPTTNAIELHCRNEQHLNQLLVADTTALNPYAHISLHAPDIPYASNTASRALLLKIQLVTERLGIANIVFHCDKVLDWDVFTEFTDLPISIENMDDRKPFGRTVADIKFILDKYPFGLTLDLQHCFVNDPSLQLAADFHKAFRHKIVAYHLSGFMPQILHYPLFKTRQDAIIEALQLRQLPIIIESTFDQMGEHEQELDYILARIKNTIQMNKTTLAEYKPTTAPLRPRTLCFLLRDNCVLLGLKKSGFGKGYYLGIGGKVEPGESVDDAVTREMIEEIGVTPIEANRVATLNFFFPYVSEPDKFNQQVCVFIARKWEGSIIESTEIKPAWFDVAQIPLDAMWDDARYWLPRVLRGESLTADFLFDLDLKVVEYTISSGSAS